MFNRTFEILSIVTISIVVMVIIAVSIPLGSPHIFAYCLLSQMGTVPVDVDAFRIFCFKEPTDSDNGVEDTPDKRVHTLYEYDRYDRYLPQSYGSVDRDVRKDSSL